ncbi:hypothetical protein ACFHW2_11930 [Actinomadura sp. LOL_016]|uniref:hypothetical protein n=1 Tax=unclassified Actinomadura TaxID=2626254 RepID=UPI003A7FD528
MSTDAQTWHVRVEWTSTEPTTGERRAALDEQLGGHAGHTGDGPNGNPRTVVTVQARTVRQAFDAAIRAVEDACKAAGLRGTVVGVEVCTEAEHARRQVEPDVPPLAGMHEIGQRLGVTRQRAQQLVNANPKTFRKVQDLSRGPVYLASAAEVFASTWTRQTGRPRKAPKADAGDA